jgi:hypothetical protein
MTNEELFYNPVEEVDYDKAHASGDFFKYLDDIRKKNFAVLEKADEYQKSKGKILYRYFTTPVADGLACYQVVEIDKKKNLAFVNWCPDAMIDDYQDSYFGGGRWADLEWVTEQIGFRDRRDEMFKKK